MERIGELVHDRKFQNPTFMLDNLSVTQGHNKQNNMYKTVLKHRTSNQYYSQFIN